MQRYNVQQRAEIVKTYYKNESSIPIMIRKLKAKFRKTKFPLKPTIDNLVNAF